MHQKLLHESLSARIGLFSAPRFVCLDGGSNIVGSKLANTVITVLAGVLKTIRNISNCTDRIALLGIDSSIVRRSQHIAHSPEWPSSLTSVVSGGARNLLLLRKRNQFVVGQEINSLNVSNDRESPARSALCLVLDGGHLESINDLK